MEFSEFVQKLHRSIGTTMGQSSFVQYLFISIVTHEKYIPACGDRIYKYYFTGRTSIKLLARAIVSHVDRDKFISDFTELSDVDDDAVDTLINEFKEEIPGIDKFNFDELIADKFKEIIVMSAKKAHINNVETSKLRINLYEECNHICPITKERLYLTGKNKFMILKIDRNNGMNEDNCLAVSPNVDKNFLRNSEQTALILEKIKTDVRELYDVEKTINDITIDEKLIQVVHKINNINVNEIAYLRYKPLKLNEKIPYDSLLCKKVSMYVETYYNTIYNEFSLMDGELHFSFKRICAQIKNTYLEYKKTNISQQIIFDNLSMFFQRKLACSSTEAEIILSFFIQNCEVFDEISE